MTVIEARIHEHLNVGMSEYRVVSVYTGTASDSMKCAGHLSLPTTEAEVLTSILDGQATHEIEYQRHGWMIRHPLACRIDLFACDANGDDLDPDEDGRYLLERDEQGYWSLGERTG